MIPSFIFASYLLQLYIHIYSYIYSGPFRSKASQSSRHLSEDIPLSVVELAEVAQSISSSVGLVGTSHFRVASRTVARPLGLYGPRYVGFLLMKNWQIRWSDAPKLEC